MWEGDSIEKFIKQYKIIRILSQNKNSLVYLVKDVFSQKKYVVKKILCNTDAGFYEGWILKKLYHPGIVKVREQIEDGRYCYLVMEYCKGVTLKSYIEKENISFLQVVSWGIELCDILIYLHRQKMPVIHRDIKPSNIIVTKHKRLKLIDFGIARRGRKMKGKAYGTRKYAAPEQFSGHYSEKSDTYNLGATLKWCWKEKGNWYWDYLMRKAMHQIPEKRYDPKQLKRRLMWLYFWF